MEQFYTLLTDIGKAKIANATALQTKVKFSKLLVGDSNGSYYEPTETQTKLRNKVWEGGIGNISIDKDNPNWIILESVIPSSVGGFTIREIGIEDEEGDLVVIAKFPQTYKPKIADGSTKDLIIKTILEVTNVDSITLKVDPTVILATKKDLIDSQKELEKNIEWDNIKNKPNLNEVGTVRSVCGHTGDITQKDLMSTNYRIYVDENIGDDSNIGDKERPVKTLEEAIRRSKRPLDSHVNYIIELLTDISMNKDIYIYNLNGCILGNKHFLHSNGYDIRFFQSIFELGDLKIENGHIYLFYSCSVLRALDIDSHEHNSLTIHCSHACIDNITCENNHSNAVSCWGSVVYLHSTTDNIHCKGCGTAVSSTSTVILGNLESITGEFDTKLYDYESSSIIAPQKN